MKQIYVLSFVLIVLISPRLELQGEEPATKKVKVGDITLDVPANWQQEPPANRLRLAQFKIAAAEGNKEPAELSVFNFGAGGTVEQQISRWVSQFESAGRKMIAKQGRADLGKYVIVDLQGTYKKPTGPPVLRRTSPMPDARMIVVMLAVKDQGNYFLKLVGKNKTVSANVDGFRNCLGAVAKNEKPLDSESQ